MNRPGWVARTVAPLRGRNPFGGDYLPSRVPLLERGRPSLPFPHPWNYREPIRILEAFWHGADPESGAGRHNRYLQVGGLPPVLVSRDPAVIQAVLSASGDKPGQFDRDTAPTSGIARATGKDSLLYSNGAIWHRQKRAVSEPFRRASLFRPDRLRAFEQTFRRRVVERLEALDTLRRATGGPTVRVVLAPEIRAVMLEMLVTCFFGGTVDPEAVRTRFVPGLEGLIERMIRDTIAPGLARLSRAIRGGDRRMRRREADFEALVDLALEGRSRRAGLWEEFRSDAPDAALRSNIRVFLAGAMEATTSFASWAISHLARRPDLQEQVHAEVSSIDSYEPDTLSSAPTLTRVLEETLRLTPALYFLPRRASADTWIELPGGRRLWIPVGTHVCLDVWHANRVEEHWGSAATGYPAVAFAPERWGRLDRAGSGPGTGLHFGFGHGPRHCPGRFLGLLEVALVVGSMVKLFRFSAVGDRAEVRAGVSTKPADEVLLDLTRRA